MKSDLGSPNFRLYSNWILVAMTAIATFTSQIISMPIGRTEEVNKLSELSLGQLKFVAKEKLDLVRRLDDNREALQARLDLINDAKKEITAQYYEIGNDGFAMASLALLRDVAKRKKVKVRIILDNREMNIAKATLAAVLNTFENDNDPNFQIKVFSPFNLFDPFNSLNRRMHDKVLTIDVPSAGEFDDGKGIVLTGGRNVANGYFRRNVKDEDGNFTTQYKDMDVMMRGSIAPVQAKQYFNDLWKHEKVKSLDLHEYSYYGLTPWLCGANGTLHGCPEITTIALNKYYFPAREKLAAALASLYTGFIFKEGDTNVMKVGAKTTDNWFKNKTGFERKAVRFIHDPALAPDGQSLEKNKNGTAASLYNFILENTRHNLTIVTPYLIVTPEQLALFRTLLSRGIKITIVTNSDHSNDVAHAQAGFELTGAQLVTMGIQVFVYKGPETLHQKQVLVDMYSAKFGYGVSDFNLSNFLLNISNLSLQETRAKINETLGRITARGVFVGSFNWDYRSQNINRETGAIILNDEDSMGAPVSSAMIDRLAINANRVKARSCAVDQYLQVGARCLGQAPENYLEIRRQIDESKTSGVARNFLKLL